MSYIITLEYQISGRDLNNRLGREFPGYLISRGDGKSKNYVFQKLTSRGDFY